MRLIKYIIPSNIYICKSYLKFVPRSDGRDVINASVDAVQNVQHARLQKLLRRFLHPTPRQNYQR